MKCKSRPCLFFYLVRHANSAHFFFRGTSEPYVCNKNNLQSVIPGLFPAERVSTSDAATSSRLQALHNKARVKYSPGYIRRGKRTPYMLMVRISMTTDSCLPPPIIDNNTIRQYTIVTSAGKCLYFHTRSICGDSRDSFVA